MEGDSTLRFTAFVCFTLLFLTPFTEVAGQKQAYKKSSRGYGYIQELDRDRESRPAQKDEPEIHQESYFGTKSSKGRSNFDWSSGRKVDEASVVKNERTSSKVTTTERRSHSFSSLDGDGSNSFADLATRLREYQKRRFGEAANTSDTFYKTGIKNGTRTVTRIEERVSQRYLPVGGRETTLNRSISSIETPLTSEDIDGAVVTESRHGTNRIDGASSTGSRKGDRGGFSSYDRDRSRTEISENERRWQGSRTWSGQTDHQEGVSGSSKTAGGSTETKTFDSNNMDKKLQEWLKTRGNKDSGQTITYDSSWSSGTGGVEIKNEEKSYGKRRHWSGRTDTQESSSRGQGGSWTSETRRQGGSTSGRDEDTSDPKGDDRRSWSTGTRTDTHDSSSRGQGGSWTSETRRQGGSTSGRGEDIEQKGDDRRSWSTGTRTDTQESSSRGQGGSWTSETRRQGGSTSGRGEDIEPKGDDRRSWSTGTRTDNQESSSRGQGGSWTSETRRQGGSTSGRGEDIEPKGDDRRSWSTGTRTDTRTREEDQYATRRKGEDRVSWNTRTDSDSKTAETDTRWSSRNDVRGSSRGTDRDSRYDYDRRQWSRTSTTRRPYDYDRSSTETPRWSSGRNASLPGEGTISRTHSRFNRTQTEIYIRKGTAGSAYNSSVSRFYNESGWGSGGQRGWKYDYDRRQEKDRDHATKVTVEETGRTPGGGGSTTCDNNSCYPRQGNLLIGREDRLSATSTCGLKRLERYCIVSHLKEKKKCFYCNSSDKRQNDKFDHGIGKIVSRISKRKGGTWWQSENGVEEVSIRLDLEAAFHLTHVIIKFKTFRPAAMLIERSSDYGLTWKIYQYFAYSCEDSFPGVPVRARQRVDDVVCDTQYSGVEPSSDGEVIFKAVPPHIHLDNPYSEEALDILSITNLRINFTKLHTFGDNLLDSREEIKEKYYFAIKEMYVRGSCFCNGHASHCVVDPELNQISKLEMVYGKCECNHNTEGKNCNKCKALYNDHPWRPAILKETNECKLCECNNHATECEFNKTLWENSGRVSGGVCTNCKHHTTGRNCDQCQSFYYQDPGRDIRDPNICQQCDCDSRGSLYDGICDPKTDLDRSTTAGNCHCKRNVDGRRCDRCKNGYWKFEENNPEGCIACTCDPMGTVENHGCNAYTGECLCKRNVIGKDCNQCLPEFWGLSTDEEGCKPCDCDPGGSYDNNCDVITGRCRCRPNINGRKCDQPENGFFAGDLDYMVYEAELARGSPDCQVLVREPYPNRDSTWTGLGFMRVFENSYLEFDVTDVPVSMEYDVVIRYEPQLSGQWEEVTVTIERPGPIDPDGPCANTIPQDDKKRVTLPSGERYIVVFPPACLEEGKNYKIRIEFKQYDNQIDTPTASILIDSIALIPRIDSIPFFQGTPQNEHRRQEYERFRCGQAFYSVVRPAPPDVCKKYLYSIGFYVYGQAHECYCDPTGSVSTACDTLGGQCTCKPNVVGKRCDRCAPGTYGFGPTGCKPCDCNSVGSLDNFCGGQSQTGQCKCRPNTYGRQCDECQPGYWNYPNCQRCDCNGHADTCDSRTGFCIDCRDFTSGHKCDRCENGFYGDPRIGKDIACRPCPCPGTVESGISHASTCELDPRTQNVICLCDQGYAGERCDRCAQNYFGDPTVPGGECKKCDCNNNVDETVAGNCDARTGECLKCLYNTEGFYCENCRDGYYGDATRQQCLECVCNLLGTNPNGGYCEKRTGQCPCLPSVVGQSCDRCEDNHWKIASGEGCEACNCDQLGSYSPTCNEYYGQCSCRAGHGGLQCNECEANFWGNPAIQCNPCNCNLNGSTTQQCHRNNGTCVCKPGIAGDRCDQCARGYTGRAPYCDPCGECFDNWDLIIQNLKDKTLELLDAASRIKQTGVTGVFTQTFTEMEEKLREVKEILDITNITSEDIDTLQRRIDEIRDQLKKTEARLTGVEDEVENTTQRITDANLTLANLRKDADALAKAAEDLKEKATTLQEDNVEGALNITRDAQKRSRAADDRVNEYSQAKEDLNNSLRLRRRTEAMLNASSGAYDKTLKANEDALNRISDEINDFTDQIPDINKQVCDGRGRVDSCDLSCGGAGCGMCGGLGCGEGAVRKAQNAEEIAKETEEKLAEKEKKATELLNKLSGVKTAAETALEEAKAAFERAKQAKNRSEDASGDIEKLIESIEAFLKAEGGKPSEIRTLAEECLDLKISLKPEEIMELARRINDTIAGLKNIDGILRDTEANLDMANKLKIRADNAKEDADDILKTAEDVLEALKEAKKAQEGAQKAIDDAKRDTKTAEEILEEIADETETAQALSNRTLDDVGGLKDRLTALKKKFVENQKDAEKAGTQSEIAERLSDRAAVDAQELERKYQEALNNLNKKAGASGKSKDRAERLRERAKKLAEDANGKLNELTGMEDAFHENEQKLKDYSEILERLNREMTEHLAVIDDRSSFYRDCQS